MTSINRVAQAPRPRAWLLSGETMPVSHPAAPVLRLQCLAAWLDELGYEPIVVDPHRRNPAPGYLEALRLLAATPVLALRARRDKPRLVLAFSALNAPAVRAISAALRGDVLLVADVPGFRSIETTQTTRRAIFRPIHRLAWRLLERSLYAQVDLALPHNDRYSQIVLRLARRGASVTTLRCGAEEELLWCTPADRASVGIPPDALAVGFLGSLVCSRLDPIFEAWQELDALALDPRLLLVVIGDGPDLQRYRQLAEARGWLGSSIVFLGGLPRAKALAALRACDIAYSECWSDLGFPSKVFEYLALGRPVVVEGKAQMTEVLRDGHDALFFRSPSELAGLLARLAREPELRARLGVAGRETFRSGHTLEHRRREFAAALAQLDPGAFGTVREAGA